jgi:hypothetical protein
VDIERRKNATEVCSRRVRFLSTANPSILPAGSKKRDRQPMCVPGILSLISLARWDSKRRGLEGSSPDFPCGTEDATRHYLDGNY